MTKRTWEDRELAILNAVFEAQEAGDNVDRAARQAVPDLADDVYADTTADLSEAGYLVAAVQRMMSGVPSVHVQRLAPRGRVAIGQWPGGRDPVEELLALLRQRLAAEKDPEERSRIEQALKGIGGLSKDVLTGILSALAAGALTGKI